MLIGYMRSYQIDEKCEEQHRQLIVQGCARIFQEVHSGPKKRTSLEQMVNDFI